MAARRKRGFFTAIFIALTIGSAFSAGQIISIPGFGDVGLEKKGSNYAIALADWGTWEFTGKFNSIKDFDLTTVIPAGQFTDYIPGAGQILGLLGFENIELRLKPNGMGYGINCAGGALGALRGTVTDTLSRVAALRMVIDKVISGFEIRSLSLNGSVFGKTMKGTVDGEVAIIGKTLKFNAEGELSLKQMVSAIVDKIVPAVTDFAADAAKAVYSEAKGAAVAVGKNSAALAKKAYDEARQVAGDLKSSVKHGSHSNSKCMNECVPNYANGQRNRMLSGSNQAVVDFLNSVRDKVVAIEGANLNETVRLRGDQFRNEWLQLLAGLDSGWQRIYDDDEVENYFFKESSEREGRAKYRGLIQESWNQNKAFRDQEFNKVLNAINYKLVRPAKPAVQALAELKLYAKAGIPVTIAMKTADLAWDLFTSPDGKFSNGSDVRFYSLHGGANQQWFLVPAGSALNAYHIRSAQSGRYIHIEGANDAKTANLITWDGAGIDVPQTVFTASADPDGFIRFSTVKGFAFDLEGGAVENGRDLRLWDKNGSNAQAFYVAPAENPVFFKTGIPAPAPKPDALAALSQLAKAKTPLTFTLSIGNLVLDLVLSNGQAPNGSAVVFNAPQGGASQQWLLVPTSKPNVYHIQSVLSGRFMHISGAKDEKGSAIVSWDGANLDAPQTCYTATADAQGFLHFLTARGLALDLRGGEQKPGTALQIWDNHGGAGQAFSVQPAKK